MDNYDLEDPKNIILRNISRIKKSDSGYFNISELKMRKEIKKNKIDVEVVFKELVNEGMMIKGNHRLECG